MEAPYESIIGSSLFKFVVGPHNKEYTIHGAAMSSLSKPLDVLLNGNMREAAEKRIEWPDVDEKTFVRFAQWAYARNYITEEPDIVLDRYSIGVPSLIQGGSDPEKMHTDREEVPEQPLYSLSSYASLASPNENCWNENCTYYGRSDHSRDICAGCSTCMGSYNTKACSGCCAIFSNCPQCGPWTDTPRTSCQNKDCNYRESINKKTHQCSRCKTTYSTKACRRCSSVFSDCPLCVDKMLQSTPSRRGNLIDKFLNEGGTEDPTPVSTFLPRRNTEGCEDYTGVFLSHAKLYVLGDKYDVPPLRQLALHRLHATLKKFTLYPSRMNDIATLAKYVFENTVPEDKIRDMITLYYACIVEDASKYDGLKSLIDEIPDFAFGLVSKMTERLA